MYLNYASMAGNAKKAKSLTLTWDVFKYLKNIIINLL